MQTHIPNLTRRRKVRLNDLIKFVPIPIAIIFIIVLVIRHNSKPENVTNSDNNDIQIAGAIATNDINKQFKLPIKDSSGEVLGDLVFFIGSAEKRNEILVKGQKATAVPGREFLIINMKIDNSLDRSVDVNTRNYVRLSVNGDESEWMAPDIHNDPVEVQAISTKLTRVGFPINSTDSLLMLQVGEIKGDKEKILLGF